MAADNFKDEIIRRRAYFRAIDDRHKPENLLLVMSRDSFRELAKEVEPWLMNFHIENPDERKFMDIPIIIAIMDGWQLVEKHEIKYG